MRELPESVGPGRAFVAMVGRFRVGAEGDSLLGWLAGGVDSGARASGKVGVGRCGLGVKGFGD
ncbi:hypothetical protein FMUAM8_50020 [Nocardia cyriacigeorgica]|nr:hypothetical protein FMUAM8_50020 [Nocardia cyriacigeorgica]